MDRIVMIANPAASQFTGGSHRAVMSTLNQSAAVEPMWPASATEATELAHSAALDGVGTVVAMGGDGMVHHVAQGLVKTDTALGIVPVGTTNVLARLLDIPSKPVRAARLISSRPPPLAIGVAEMGLRRGAVDTSHIAVFSCGFGLDAAVVLEADKEPFRKYRFGSIHYATSAFRVGLRDFPKRTPNMAVTGDDFETAASTVLVQFRKIYTYFGRIALRLAPGHPDPMTVLTVDRLKRRRVPKITLTALLGGNLNSVGGMETWPGIEQLSVTASPPVEVQADGESLGMVDGGTVRWLPDALRVVVPQVSP